MKKILCFLCICIMFCGCAKHDKEETQDKVTLTVAVPASDTGIISKYLNQYKNQSDIDFKIIDVSGDSEDIHRFYVSTCIDDKFNVDMYFLEANWVDEFARCGYIDEIDLSSYEFIPAVQETVTYKRKAYAMPVYADVYAEFRKHGNNTENVMLLESDTKDYLAGVYSLIENSESLEAAVSEYESGNRSNNIDEFIFGDFATARGWLNQYNDMKERYAIEASNISVNIDKKAVIETKTFAVSKKTKHTKEIQKVLDYFLQDSTQKSLMTDTIAIPVLKSFYERDDLYDVTPHILYVDGMDFISVKADENYTADIKTLNDFLNQHDDDVQGKLEIIGRLIFK